jgi:hypothetical protein
MRPDQYALPKDIVLGVFGFIAAVQCLAKRSPIRTDVVDGLFVAALCWGALLTPIVAVNAYESWRALAGFGAGLAVFMLARAAAAESDPERLYRGLCAIIAVVSALVLLEAWGAIPFVSEPGRRPGATFGNRNLVARVLCLTLPLVCRQLFLADSVTVRRLFISIASASIAAIVMSRSRGAWLVTLVVAAGMPVVWRVTSPSVNVEYFMAGTRRWALAVLSGIALALLVPNRLDWSAQDFASSARRSLDYETGTGRERLRQAEVTWDMIASSPLGIGPGNWSIVYPRYAGRDDPSLTPNGLFPGPRVPRGDALSLGAEFGLVGIATGITVAVFIVFLALRNLRNSPNCMRGTAVMLIFVVLAALLLGLIEPVLRLSPSLGLLAVVVGAGIGDLLRLNGYIPIARLRISYLRAIMLGLVIASLSFADAARRDLTALRIISSLDSPDDLYRAVAVSPNNYEARMMAAYVLIRADQCDLAIPHLEHANRLQPYADAVKTLSMSCGRKNSPR